MAIDIIDEIMKHDDSEIIEYLFKEMSRVYRNITEAEDTSYVLAESCRIEQIYLVLREMNRRNKERGIK